MREPIGISEGERIALTPDPAHIHLFDADGAAIFAPEPVIQICDRIATCGAAM